MSDDGSGTASGVRVTTQFGHQRRDVVAVEFGGSPAEGGPFVAEWRQGHDFLAAAGGLPLVVIDDDCERAELLGGGEQGGFPDGAFVALAITEADEDPLGLSANACGEGQSEAHGESVPEGSRGEFNAWGAVRGRLFGELRAVGGELVDPGFWEEAALGEYGVERRGCVALAENKAVAVRVVWLRGVDAEDPPVERNEDIHARQGRPEMRRASPVRHLHDPEAQERGDPGEFWVGDGGHKKWTMPWTTSPERMRVMASLMSSSPTRWETMAAGLKRPAAIMRR